MTRAGSRYTIPPTSRSRRSRGRDLRLRPAQPLALLVRQPHGRSPDRRRRRRRAGRRSTCSPPASRPARTSAGPAGRARTRTAARAAPRPGAMPPIFEYAHSATALLDHGRLRRPRPDGAHARRPLPLRRLLRDGRERPAPARRRRRPTSRSSGRWTTIAGFGSGLRRPPLRHVAAGRRVARDRHRRGGQAARRRLHAVQHDARRSARTCASTRRPRPTPTARIISYSWDTDGDGKADGKGMTFDVSYPTAGARADHAHGRRRGRRALLAHSGGLRRRQDDAAGHDRTRSRSCARR